MTLIKYETTRKNGVSALDEFKVYTIDSPATGGAFHQVQDELKSALGL